MLKKIADFAIQHKMKWDVDQYKVMQIGRSKNVVETWKLGDKTIESALEYEYLGDITRIGTNKRNLEERQKEVNWAVCGIKSCAQHEVIEKV